MSEYHSKYNPKRSANWNYGGNNWKLSRSKIELFTTCQRCFYIDNKLGAKRPSIPSFLINTAVDTQLKNEFDAYRREGKAHPFQEEFGVDAIPAPHEKLNTWRENFEGVQYFDTETGMTISGAIDDLWINPKTGEYIVVDYKATSKKGTVNLDADWQQSYKRQLEIYQWLLKRNGFKVSPHGYFVYTNADSSLNQFNDTLKFETVVIEHIGSTEWVDDLVLKAKECLEADMPPVGKSIMGGDCEYCAYARQRTELTLNHLTKTKK
jgi:hypothetical protein